MMVLVDTTNARTAADWLKDFLYHKHDLIVSHVVHRPPMWCLYDADNNFIMQLEEELMDRIHLAIHRESTDSFAPENSLAQVLLGDTWQDRDLEADDRTYDVDEDDEDMA